MSIEAPTGEITQYIVEINRIYKTGNATEHSYRSALKSLLEHVTSPNPSKGGGFVITNEPKRIACGAPDYIVTKGEIPVGYIEAKDIGANLNDKAYKEQLDRYKQSLNNLIITDYLTFQLFENESLITEISIGKISSDKIVPVSESFNAFYEMIKHFMLYNGKVIKDSQKLAEYMAAKTQLLAEVIEKAITEEDDNHLLIQQLKGFQQVLLPTMTRAQFADIYAQTIAYGMFVARLNMHDECRGAMHCASTFNRQQAAALIPQSNPFLRNLFQYIAGFDLDENIRWIVDSLADMFNYVDIDAIHKEFVSIEKDTFLHFYEVFLTKYDKTLKTARGAFYTPLPVVKFIVNAVNDILKQDFGIKQGLADTSKITLKQFFPQDDGKEKEEERVYHRVQILDPATGTGTFLAEVVRNIYQQFENNKGMWNDYVKHHLIPRLNGFEIMMAPYTMAHLKLEMMLHELNHPAETQCIASLHNRLHIYLTDTLEDPKTIKKYDVPFAQWLGNEAKEAAAIKNKVPVMVILGNPPYSVSTQNKSKWIAELLKDYKKELYETKLNLDDDYIKFIRYGQHYIEKNEMGILAYISNNSFIDGVTHRQMRKNLLETFDKIYILDLHGNAKKKETAPDGSKDENVFDIMQGVSINIFVKTGK